MRASSNGKRDIKKIIAVKAASGSSAPKLSVQAIKVIAAITNNIMINRFSKSKCFVGSMPDLFMMKVT